jgi:hypothetical protein
MFRPGAEVLTDKYHPFHRLWDEHGQFSRKRRSMKKDSNYIKKRPNGEPLGNEKSPDLAAFCDEELTELPPFNLIPEGLILISVVDNGTFEAALVCDNEFDYSRVQRAQSSGEDPRPVRFFLVKREWVRQMAEHPLVSDQEGGR